MYSKFSSKGEGSGIQIPEHYSGCAFSPAPSKKAPSASEKHTPTFLEVAKPSPTPITSQPKAEKAPPPLPPPKEEEPNPHESEEKKNSVQASAPAPFASLFGNLGHSFPFTHGLGFEELLILGLILLLSRNEGESDAVLLLGLLLFCG